MYVKLTIAERLKDLRTERRLTLEQLAEQTGLSRAALGRYESDDCKEISPTAVVTLAKFYGVTTDYLLECDEGGINLSAKEMSLIWQLRRMTPSQRDVVVELINVMTKKNKG